MVVRFITLCLLFTITAGPVWACGILAKAEPKVGSSVSSTTTAIRITFSEAIVPGKSSITLTNAAGEPVKTNAFQTSKSDSVMALPLASPLPAGDYKVHWKVLWKDCDSETEGTYGFTVAP